MSQASKQIPRGPNYAGKAKLPPPIPNPIELRAVISDLTLGEASVLAIAIDRARGLSDATLAFDLTVEHISESLGIGKQAYQGARERLDGLGLLHEAPGLTHLGGKQYALDWRELRRRLENAQAPEETQSDCAKWVIQALAEAVAAGRALGTISAKVPQTRRHVSEEADALADSWIEWVQKLGGVDLDFDSAQRSSLHKLIEGRGYDGVEDLIVYVACSGDLYRPQVSSPQQLASKWNEVATARARFRERDGIAKPPGLASDVPEDDLPF